MDLHARTLDALDWPVVLGALARHARTSLGAEAAAGLPLLDEVADIRRAYVAVDELRVVEDEDGSRMPVGGVGDVREPVARAVRGTVLEAAELRSIGDALAGLDLLKRWLEARGDRAPELDAMGAGVHVDANLLDWLLHSFDASGALSGERYPEIGDLRRRVLALKARIQAVLDSIVRDEGTASLLQDRFVTERGGRYVVPVRAGAHRRGFGIVHATSQSGETLFVEPAEVVERTNELKEVEAALERAERRVLTQLSRLVAAGAPGIATSLEAATALDLVAARVGLGRQLGGVVPQVGASGRLHLVRSRHPVLVLRGVDVVANDLDLGGAARGLVLTGPNTGGKTVALKTLGLAALFARAAIPFPAEEGSRIDCFRPILADVGDLQSVEGDLSTFSGHVVVLKHVLAVAAPGALVLMDEMGVGTDPAQGAALARAVLEALVDAGAEVAVTTHYAELKGLAASDPRFAVAAVQVRDGRPTYRVAAGLAGESHGLETARRLALPEAVVARARAVLDAGTRDLADLMAELDAARAEATDRAAALAAAQEQLALREKDVQRRLRLLDEKRQKVREEVGASFEARLRKQEDELKGIIAALQRSPDSRRAGATLERLRSVRDAARGELSGGEEVAPPDEIAVGDSVYVRSLHKEGEVVADHGRGRYSVRVGPRTSRPVTAGPPRSGPRAPRQPPRQRRPRAARRCAPAPRTRSRPSASTSTPWTCAGSGSTRRSTPWTRTWTPWWSAARRWRSCCTGTARARSRPRCASGCPRARG